MRPIAACAMEVVERTRVSQVTPVTPSIPRAMVYGLYRALPGEPGFLAPVTPEKLASQELDTSVGASGPHDFAVRLSAVRYRRIRVHRIPPRVRDDREPPLCGTGRRGYRLIWVFGKTEYFLAKGWTRREIQAHPVADLPVGQNQTTASIEECSDEGSHFTWLRELLFIY